MLQRSADLEGRDRRSFFAICMPEAALRCVAAIVMLGASATVVPAQMMSLPGKFDVTGTGGARYSIPIAVPPGTAGMAPSLALAYHSAAKNDLVGVGFRPEHVKTAEAPGATWVRPSVAVWDPEESAAARRDRKPSHRHQQPLRQIR